MGMLGKIVINVMANSPNKSCKQEKQTICKLGNLTRLRYGFMMDIWGVPEIGVPQNHPYFRLGFSLCKPSSYYGTPNLGKPPIFIYIYMFHVHIDVPKKNMQI